MTNTATPTAPDFKAMKADIADKVRKLLIQAEDSGCTDEEAQAFSAKAQQLMSRYSITLAMVKDADKTDKLTEDNIVVEGLWASRKTTLLGAIARNNDCRAVQWKVGSGRYRVSVVGYASDIEWVRTLYTSLDFQLAAALRKSVKTEKPSDVHGRSWGASFVGGYTSAVSARLRQARREAVRVAEREQEAAKALEAGEAPVVATSSSVALVLVAKAAKVEDEFKIRHPHTRTVQTARLTSGSAYRSGHTAGTNASLARGSVGGGSRGSLGR